MYLDIQEEKRVEREMGHQIQVLMLQFSLWSSRNVHALHISLLAIKSVILFI